jgi:hypothetical protein
LTALLTAAVATALAAAGATPARGTMRATPARGTMRATPARGTMRTTPARGTMRATPARWAMRIAPARWAMRIAPARATVRLRAAFSWRGRRRAISVDFVQYLVAFDLGLGHQWLIIVVVFLARRVLCTVAGLRRAPRRIALALAVAGCARHPCSLQQPGKLGLL